uniref:Uncharacterized protein n=1 Tax=Strongyloides papillosus TaxID=174720 RepID=A0A0N5CIL4_STREA
MQEEKEANNQIECIVIDDDKVEVTMIKNPITQLPNGPNRILLSSIGEKESEYNTVMIGKAVTTKYLKIQQFEGLHSMKFSPFSKISLCQIPDIQRRLEMLKYNDFEEKNKSIPPTASQINGNENINITGKIKSFKDFLITAFDNCAEKLLQKTAEDVSNILNGHGNCDMYGITSNLIKKNYIFYIRKKNSDLIAYDCKEVINQH